MFDYVIKLIMFSNSIFIIFISLYLIFSRKNEPKEYPEEFSKTYIIKPQKKNYKF